MNEAGAIDEDGVVLVTNSVHMSSNHKTDMQPVLVTGGCGFIGASLVRGLVETGYRVRVLDDLSTGNPANLAGVEVEIINGSVCDRHAVERAVAGCSSVVHLAAQASVLESTIDPWPSFQVNAGGTLTLLQASVQAGVSRFVFASSNAAIGDHEPPIDESKVPRPISPYGASKLAGEAYCLVHAGTYGLGTVVLRFSNVYGPYSDHKPSVVAKFMRMLLAGEPITIYGDGLQTRDFIYVADVVQAILAALQCPLAGEVLQVGTGRETTILELVQMLGEISGATPILRWLDQPPGEIRRNFTAIDRTRSQLGFSPAWELRSGLEQTFSWLTHHRTLEHATPHDGGEGTTDG